MRVQITGAGHGIGKELALRYASLGATVICWDLNQQTNEETVNEIRKMGTTAAYAYQCVYYICIRLLYFEKNPTEKFITLSFKCIRQKSNDIFHLHRCDVSKREEVLSVAERVKREVGDVTILVNNAGVMPCHAFLDHTIDEIRRIFDINVLAHFWVS